MNDEMRTYPPKKRQLLRVQPSVARQSQTAEGRADKFMQAVNAMKTALDTEGLEKNLDLEIAVRHNLRRKIRMIKSMQGLYRHLRGNGPKPHTLPSEAFDPFEGVDRANVHYLIKAMSAQPPWELQKELLVVPTAVTLMMLEVAAKLFPAPPVFRHRLLVEEFINRWTLPKFRPEWDKKELQRQIDKYTGDMENFEERFKASYAELSIYFGSLENPEKNPTEKKIDETHKRTRKMSEKLCPAEENASFVAQEWAYERWLEFKKNPVAKTQYCTKRHRLNHDDCYDFNKRQAVEHGFKTAAQFDRAINAAQKRKRRKS